MRDGIEYFSFDVMMHEDDKVQMLLAHHGAIGHYILIRLLCKIYSQGYAYFWSDKVSRLFAYNLSVDYILVKDVVSLCIDANIFDQKVYAKYGHLTSTGIQKRYLAATFRRKRVVLSQELWLLANDSTFKSRNFERYILEFTGIVENAYINCDSVDVVHTETEKMCTNLNKVKESKGKENLYLVQKAQIIDHLNKKLGTRYRADTKETADLIDARISDGYTVDDCIKVIDKKVDEWRGTQYERYLRPKTLFGAKFESYHNQKIISGSKSNFKERDIPDEEIEKINNELLNHKYF